MIFKKFMEIEFMKTHIYMTNNFISILVGSIKEKV